MKFFKNRFLFIMLISIATLVVLIIGAFALYEDKSAVFASDGYILETTTKTNKKYYFSANTKYKENVDNQIAFSDNDSKQVAVDPASFVHYLNGNVSFLKKGALVNLADITSPMVSYYNITTENTIVKDKEQYTVTSNDKKINIESFIGRINDNKYLIAGSNLSIKVPKVDERINGEYFEILFIEEGIVKIDNQEASYQVTAQDSYVYVGDNITISLENGKIFHDGEAKMLLSQITINNNENINLDVEEENKAGGGSGSGSGSGSGEGAEGTDGTGEGSEGADVGEGTGESGEGSGSGGGDGTGEGTGEGEGSGSGGGDGTGEGTGDGTGSGGSGGDGNSGTGISSTTESPQVELIEAIVTSTKIDLSLQLNNATLAQGNITAYLTNVSTGAREYAKNIDLVNGTFKIVKESLSPSTEYALTIVETGSDTERQYFQKTFKTKELGITLQKVYATEDSLAYAIIFEENTDVTMARISIYDNNGSPAPIPTNEYSVSKNDLNNKVIFSGLNSNTSYSVNIDTVWVDNAAYSSVYTINRIDTTLKKTPRISGIKVEPNAEEVKFTINLNTIEDKDKSIVSYTYNIYLADDITLENPEPEIKYSVTKNDSDALVLNLNEISELKTGVDYRCKITAQYHDNEMIREVSTDYSNNFLIRSKPKLNFELNATMNKIEGTISLIDANCTVPINGRTCSNGGNTFTLRYYESSEEESNAINEIIKFDSTKLTSEISLTNLKSNTYYVIKVFGDYYDDDNVLHPNVQIGDTFSIRTPKSDNIYFEHVGDNKSGHNKDGSVNSANVVTFDARLTAPQDSSIVEEISTITLNLYSGRYNVKEKLIGTYTFTEKKDIANFFNNLTITNSLFTDVTGKEGRIDSLAKMIKVTNPSNEKNKTLNGAYTVEVEDVYDSSGVNKITVENNVYTFNLTPSYYLDARIETNPQENYITVTPITKENLTEEEYETLAKTVKNLDSLNEDTVVGLTIENSLSDMFVDSAFTYEKAIVNYTIFNQTTNSLIKTITFDMGNKYQPKTQIVYLDSSELDDGKKYFTRGYKYKIGYHIDFITEDGSNPTYKNDKLYKVMPIERQTPIYTQYISTSNSNGITYRYSFSDIDKSIANKNFYYTIGEASVKDKTYNEIPNTLIADNKYHEVTVPLNTNTMYSLYYPKKNTDNIAEFVSISTYDFETEYQYNEEVAYTIINDNDNVLKLRLENNDVTNRGIIYKVVIDTKERNNVPTYTKYFLASRLNTLEEDTGKKDEEGNPIINNYKYIAIDYANISRFMGYEMNITLYSYYDSGLVGLDQSLKNGAIFKNRETGKYLNIYNSGSNVASFARSDIENMGLYLLKEPFKKDDTTIYLYNKLMDTEYYNSLIGASYYETEDLAANIGVKFGVSFSNAGIVLNDGKTDHMGYNARVLKEAKLKTEKNTHKFNTIIPKIKVTTNISNDKANSNTINSVRVMLEPTGIYGNKQFIKNGVEHNKVYVEFYSDAETSTKLKTIESPITITGSEKDGYKATIENVEYNNLTPATTYYFKVFAYIDGKYTQLYDSSSTTSYITKTYESTTLTASKLLSSIKFAVEPKRYKGEISEKELTWSLGLKNTENYKLRFELYEPKGTITTTDPETGEEIVVPNFVPVNFNGTNASSCDITKIGNSSNGYVNNCYISVSRDNISSINNKSNTYKFTGNDFVFGGNYYKLIVYAIPYTNNKYDEDNKVILYQNDSLTTTGIMSVGGITYNISIPFLEEAYFDLKNTLTAGHNDAEGYYVSFTPTIYDTHKVIKYGTYTIKLKDEKGNTIKLLTNVDANEVNKEIKFTELSSNTLYYVELSYETFRNNIGFNEIQKTNATPFTDFTYTPIDAGITLGTITAGQSTTTNVTLTYNGSANLSNNIVAVDYTISLKGGSSKTSGTYRVSTDTPNIFTIATDKTPRLTINTSDSKFSSNTGFNFKSGNTYIITTQYYYLVNGKETILTDKETGNSTHTTILNL